MTLPLARLAHPTSRGQALVEFALIAPIFFLLLFSIIQFGILFGGQNGLVASSRELARYAAPYRVQTDTDAGNVCADGRLRTQIDTFMRQSIPAFVLANVKDVTITYSWFPNANNTVANPSYYIQIEASIRYRYTLFVPLVGGLIDRFDGTADNRFMLSATEQMRIENSDLKATFSPHICVVEVNP